MKHILLAAFVALSFNASAQPVFDWVETQPVGWDLNPSFTKHLVTTDGMNRSVAARFVSNTVDYTGLFGTYSIDVRESDGGLVWSYPLGNKVQVQAIAADASGNVYIGGTFMQTLFHGAFDQLIHIGGVTDTFDVNAFLLKLDANGELEWIRNLEPLQPGLDNIADIRIDKDGDAWYAYNETFSGLLQEIDDNGTDVGFTRYIGGVRGISSFDFDPDNNIFITGACDPGQVELAPLEYDVTDSYNIYIAKFDAAGVGQWAKFAHDITFQMPVVECDASGNAFVGGTLMDTMTLGTHHLNAPQWVNDFWLTKVDGDGVFLWAKQGPQPMSLQGDVARADGKFIDVDDAGDVYMLANVRGANDFGNGVFIDAGATSQSNMAVIKFAGTDGEAQWAANGGATSFNSTHQLALDENDNIYFTRTLTDTSNYGFIHIDIAYWTNHFTLGKITVLQDTSIGVSIEDISTKAFSLYPNPASTFVLIPLDLQGAELSVFDATGKQVAFYQGVGNKVDVESLPNGVYTLRFTNERVRFVGKLLKE